MTDTPDPQSTDNANGETEEASGPYIHAHAQYIKDLSFENPVAIDVVTSEGIDPHVNLSCSVESTQLGETAYEVVLSMEGRAVQDDKTLFLVAVDYGGMFTLSNVPEEHIDPILKIHCATLLFPFARSIIANVTREGGYPPLLIDIIDFSQLYQGLKAAGNGAGNGGNGNGADETTEDGGDTGETPA
ncbi:MAG TPA: protein-export chaperone SecB [Alphaproteobacteria bacterium]|nr:protein-export chaperone SecB [Alphaproteobacteria bacterium]